MEETETKKVGLYNLNRPEYMFELRLDTNKFGKPTFENTNEEKNAFLDFHASEQYTGYAARFHIKPGAGDIVKLPGFDQFFCSENSECEELFIDDPAIYQVILSGQDWQNKKRRNRAPYSVAAAVETENVCCKRKWWEPQYYYLRGRAKEYRGRCVCNIYESLPIGLFLPLEGFVLYSLT